MKKLISMVAVLGFLAACGGGGSSNSLPDVADTPDVTAPADDVADTGDTDDVLDDGLPAIKDEYEDTFFLYADMNLYEGTYTINPEGNGCGHVESTIDVLSVDDKKLATVTGGVAEEYDYVLHNVADLYVYDFFVDELYCTLGFGSMNSAAGGATIDFLGLYCEDDATDQWCYTEWLRDAAYDFSSETIKSVGGASASMKDLLHDITSSQ